MGRLATEQSLRRELTRAERRIELLLQALVELAENPGSEDAHRAAEGTIQIAQSWVSEK